MDGYQPGTENGRSLLAKWRAARGIRSIPNRAHLPMTELQNMIPRIQMLEVVGDRFFVRSAGSATHKGGDPTGAFLEDTPQNSGQATVATLKSVVREKRPRFASTDPAGDREEAYFPLSRDGASVNMVLRVMIGAA